MSETYSICTDRLGKKFSRSLKRSMVYGVVDIFRHAFERVMMIEPWEARS